MDIIFKKLVFLLVFAITQLHIETCYAKQNNSLKYGIVLDAKIDFLIGYFEAISKIFNIKLEQGYPADLLFISKEDAFLKNSLNEIQSVFFHDKEMKTIFIKKYSGETCGYWKRDDVYYKYILIIDKNNSKAAIEGCAAFVFEIIMDDVFQDFSKLELGK